MGILGNAKDGVNNVQQKIMNPFKKKVINTTRTDDFPEGFNIEELGGQEESIKLNGNLAPHETFVYAGKQRIVKEYYAGQSEPAVHVMGPQEEPVTIKGRFKDKKYTDPFLYGVAEEISQLVTAMRIRGNVVRIFMGEWQRYAIIESESFELKNIGDISYSITFEIIGFNAPQNGKFIEKKREIPFEINKELIQRAFDLQNDLTNIPDTVPQSISDVIRDVTGTVAEAIGIVTGFVDTVISTTNDVRKSTQRAVGLIKHSQNKLREYKDFLGGLDLLDANQALTGRYANASYYSNRLSNANALASLLARFRTQFSSLIEDLPLGRHFVRDGESLQRLASKYYNDSTLWKKIQDHNNLQSADISSGMILEIPRLT